MSLAELVSTWSKDPSTQVGAVIVDSDNRVVSLGFNGLPRGAKDDHDRLHNREVKYALTMHAEMNAVLFAQRSLNGCTVYVTQPPCSHCAGVLAQSGVSKVITRTPSEDFRNRWASSMALSAEVLSEAGIDIEYISAVE